ncbi:MAG: response regulator [Bacteroidetes bacterium]|nr:response regulator [Bacteroidota bacterium]MCL6098921.1 response regulator [Bacteroidota bacterium]
MAGKPRLLMIDDDELTLRIFTIIISKLFNVTSCKFGDEFLNLLKKKEFDVFLIDLSLKGEIDGIQLIKELRTSVKYKDYPIVVVTANAFKKDEEVAMAAGASKFLRKPIENERLLQELREYI